MRTTTIRVSAEVRDALQRISKAKGITLQEATAQAVESYRRQQILEAANAAYARLRSDPSASAAYDADPPGWDGTLGDGLDED